MERWALIHIALAGVWGGALALERRGFLQAMFSRPLVAATGMGLILGDLQAGLYIGMLLELFHLGSANLGAALPDHDTLSASATAAAAVTLAHQSGAESTPAHWTLALLLFVGMGRVGRKVDRMLERYTNQLVVKAQLSLARGELTRAVRNNLWGLWPHFACFGLITAFCASVGWLLSPYVDLLPLKILRGLAWAYPAMACVSAAIAVRGAGARRGWIYATMAAAVTIVLVVVKRGMI